MTGSELLDKVDIDNASRKPTARGQFWEVTYIAEAPPFLSWKLSSASDLLNETGKTYVTITTDPECVIRAINLKEKEFKVCDINHFELADSSFSNCKFIDCRFIKANFRNVKFSGCRFEKCHLLNVRFEQCQFIDCTFVRLSASAEQARFVATTIPASSFIDALATNITALPASKTKEYQEHRHLFNKTRLARSIFLSVKDDPELDHVFDANRCFEILLHRRRIAESAWSVKDDELVPQSWFRRYIIRLFQVITFGLILVAGFFTLWGKSPLRSAWFLVIAIAVFSAIYWLVFGQQLGWALLRALDCTLVFGYTKYLVDEKQDATIAIAMFINAFFGFCWYALLIPALSRRLFR